MEHEAEAVSRRKAPVPGREEPVPGRKRTVSRQKRLEAFYGYLFIAPNFVAIFLFLVIPIFLSLYLSFTSWDLINPPEFVGLEHYTENMIGDEQFWTSLKNTVVFTLITIPLSIGLGLFFALLLNQALTGGEVYKAIIFLPVIVAMVSVAMVWRWILNTDVGVLNYLLNLVGISGLGWITDRRFALVSVSLVAVWKSIGFNMVILLAGLKGIPAQLYEAATIDGAGGWNKLVKITLPLLTPTLFFVSIIAVISSFQAFDVVYMITGGGPGDATRVLYYWLWQNGFVFFKMGYASALSWVVFLVLLVLTLLQVKVFGGRVNYDL